MEQNTAPHLVVLIICLGILAASLVLKPQGSQLLMGQTTLPGLCVLRHTTGVPCPGCGLTRSMVLAARGEWARSQGFHRLGPVVLIFILLQALYRLTWLSVAPFRNPIARAGRLLDLALCPLMVLMFINWIPTLLDVIGRN